MFSLSLLFHKSVRQLLTLLGYNSSSLPSSPKFLSKLPPSAPLSPVSTQELQCENTTHRRLLSLQIPSHITPDKALLFSLTVTSTPLRAPAQFRALQEGLHPSQRQLQHRAETDRRLCTMPMRHELNSTLPATHKQVLRLSSQHPQHRRILSAT